MSKNEGSRSKTKKVGKNTSFVSATGKLEITKSGTGYVIINDELGDVLVRPGNFNQAFNGDIVKVKVLKENTVTKKREGKVMEIVSRKQTEFLGVIQLSATFAFFVPSGDRPMPDFFVPLDKLNGAKNKDKVICKMTEWGKDDKKPVGEVISIFNSISDGDSAMKEILLGAGFQLEFSKEAFDIAENIPEVIPESEIALRKDCRDILTFTIDPFDAKDFDDAISIRKLKKDVYEIGVHIADVAYYVEENSPLDLEAFKRATSVYLPDRVNPMLPERISNHLCSLRPNEDKCTFSVIYQITSKGEIKQFWIGRTVIHSDKRFSYEEIQETIEKKEGVYLDEILLLNNLAQQFRKERFQKGAINFSSTEIRFRLDEAGKPIEVIFKESKEAHQLIEEFMLLANKTIAEKVSKQNTSSLHIPFPYRIHDRPDEKKLTPFIEYAKRFGHVFDTNSPKKIAESFNSMLNMVKEKPEQHVLEQLGIRTMAKATYSPKNIGHYGLAFEHYCHFTSPIRRYPDIMVHRIIASILSNTPLIDKKMEEKCKHVSERERAAMDCERTANKYKQVEFMHQFLGKELPCVISGVAGFGFFVESIDYKCEGLVSIPSLANTDDFMHIESEYCLRGKKTGLVFKMGDKVTARLIAANLEKRQLDFDLVLPSKAVLTPKSEGNTKSSSRKRPGKSKTTQALTTTQEKTESSLKKKSTKKESKDNIAP